MTERQPLQSTQPEIFSDEIRYINRELSWLDFNSRVLEEACDPSNPLLERLKFLAIVSSNLAEFFMVRVAGLLRLQDEGLHVYSSPGHPASSRALQEIRIKVLEIVDRQRKCLHLDIRPQLETRGIKILQMNELSEDQRKFLNKYFFEELFHVLTPLSVDAAHPFPTLSNMAIYLLVSYQRYSAGEEKPGLGFVEIPAVLPRLIQLPSEPNIYQYVLLENVVAEYLDSIFIGIKLRTCFSVRVTRNLDYTLLENEVVDLLQSMKAELVSREHQEAVRLETDQPLPEQILEKLKKELALSDSDIYCSGSPLQITDLAVLSKLPLEDLKFPAFNPRLPQSMSSREDIFALIAKEDILVHHPYESFYAVTEFLISAAHDPNVVAIKQMLYRAAGDSPIIDSLITAAENGKHVTAVIELKARFDEKNNMVWARKLERAGVNVVFGFVGLKTHSKACLVIRKEAGRLVRYTHLSTGNYNSTTAKLYTDIGLFSCDPGLSHDVAILFNLVTGFNMLSAGDDNPEQSALPELKKIKIGPLNLRQSFIKLIEDEAAIARSGKPAQIIAKMNALVDRAIIDSLYAASQAGVKITLIVRGICCLRPRIQGLSTNIEVISIIDRFLEHSRIYYFQNDGNEKVFLSSADWMARNMDRRVEILFPIESPKLRRRIVDEILATYLSDNQKARIMTAEGFYYLRQKSAQESPIRAQFRFIDLARTDGLKSVPYEIAIKHNALRTRGERPVQGKQRKEKDRKRK